MAVKNLYILTDDGRFETYKGKSVSSGAADAGEVVVMGANGKLDPTLFGNGFGPDCVTATAGEAINGGDVVYFSATGTILKADATSPAKAAQGYVLAAVANGEQGTVYFDETNSSVTGLTPGRTYYLSTTPGKLTATPPTATGSVVQAIGFSITPTSLHVGLGNPVTRG
jgi:hypothetical protein